jgi:hypothetical protein
MLNALLRWLVPLIALLVFGPLAGKLTSSLRALDGGPQASLLVCAHPSAGVLAGLGTIGLAIVAGLIASVLIGSRMGLFCAGLVLAWGAWGTGRLPDMIAQAQSGSILKQIALEAVIVGVLGVLGAALILLVPARRTVPQAGAAPAQHVLPPEPRLIRDKAGPTGALVAFLIGAVVTYLVAQEGLKGQTFAAAAIAGLLGAAAGRVVATYASAMWFFVGLCTIGVIAPLIAMFMHGMSVPAGSSVDGVVRAALAGGLFRPANVLPLDLLAGAFIGVPMGLAWAGSMVERHARPSIKTA